MNDLQVEIRMRDIHRQTRRDVLKAVGAGAAGGFALTGTAAARGKGGLQRELAEVRAATAKYNDPENAIADGYIPQEHPVCGMGYHYPHEDFMRAIKEGTLAEYLASLDRTEPPVITYGEGDDGLVLGAVEYLTFDPTTDLFPSTEADEWHPFGRLLYAMHAWVHTPNPDGVFHPTNPRHQFTRPEWCDDGDNH